ncbi:formate/nitrite transporter family protein [Porticoccus sp. GXU_MW_L64]
MYEQTLQHFAELARKKSDVLRDKPAAFCVGALMAGAYVGLGIILIFSVAVGIDPSWQKLVMGVSFGIALTLVVFAGAELFTGHTMYMVIGQLKGLTSWTDLAKTWLSSWGCNLIGSVGLAALFMVGGSGALIYDNAALLNKVAEYKMNSPAIALLARAVLCNWLVCLALWMSARTRNDVAKCVVIFWCLFTFIASGYEHCVANMTLLALALLANPTEAVTLGGMAHNLFWVTLGNIIGGGLFMAFGYWLASGKPTALSQSDQRGQS